MSQIVTNVSIPSKAVSLAPRQSIYPVDAIIAAGIGAAFAIELRGTNEDGTQFLLDDEALKKLASQKQSQISGLAKTRNVDFTTRLIEDQATADAFGVTVPALGVWYTSETRTVKPRKTKADAAVAGGEGVPALPESDSDAADVPEIPTI